jgi:predicted GIY-YIG superfamily endonuclease
MNSLNNFVLMCKNYFIILKKKILERREEKFDFKQNKSFLFFLISMQKNGFVYIITDQVGGKLSVGVTTDLSKRLHRLCTVSKQSTRPKNETPRLVYVERRQHVLDALIRKQTLAK